MQERVPQVGSHHRLVLVHPVEHPACVVNGADREVDEPGEEELIGVQPVDVEVRVDLAHVREGAASREERGKGGGGGRDVGLQPRGYLRTLTPILCPEEQEAGAPEPHLEEERPTRLRRRAPEPPRDRVEEDEPHDHLAQ